MKILVIISVIVGLAVCGYLALEAVQVTKETRSYTSEEVLNAFPIDPRMK